MTHFVIHWKLFHHDKYNSENGESELNLGKSDDNKVAHKENGLNTSKNNL